VRVQVKMIMAFPPAGGHRICLIDYERIKTSPADCPGSRQPSRASADHHDMFLHDASLAAILPAVNTTHLLPREVRPRPAERHP